MSRLRRFDYGTHDDLAQTFNDIFDGFLSTPVTSPFSFRGTLVDENEYDIVPKASHWQRKLKEEEEKLTRLKKRKDMEIAFYEREIERTNGEIENIKRKISP